MPYEDDFIKLAQETLFQASKVKATKEEYMDGLEILIAEIEMAKEAVIQELKNEK